MFPFSLKVIQVEFDFTIDTSTVTAKPYGKVILHVSNFKTHNCITEIAFGNHCYFDQMTKIVTTLNNARFPL